MAKQNASLDASFWINACAGAVVEYLAAYFRLFTHMVVADEIRYPLTVLGIQAHSAVLFNEWVRTRKVLLQDPQAPMVWYQQGENAAIGLAVERNYLLLMDDANPYHRARSVGLKVVGTAEFVVLLFDQGQISYDDAVNAIKQTHASKNQKRDALIVMEMVARRKGK
jgi:predicted nucleic acid-binding protein